MDHYGYNLVRQGSGVWRTLRDGDFEEGDVWDVLRERKDNSGPKFNKSSSSSSLISGPRNIPSASRMIPRGNNNYNTTNISSGSSSDSSQEHKIVHQSSAPLNIPDWSKMRKKKSKLDDIGREDHDCHHNYDDYFNGVENFDGDEEINDDNADEEHGDDGEGEYNYKVPPHEFIARRLARSHISSFSVFEGVGRTLKGRDLKKVRNAVLTKTGFLESP